MNFRELEILRYNLLRTKEFLNALDRADVLKGLSKIGASTIDLTADADGVPYFATMSKEALMKICDLLEIEIRAKRNQNAYPYSYYAPCKAKADDEKTFFKRLLIFLPLCFFWGFVVGMAVMFMVRH